MFNKIDCKYFILTNPTVKMLILTIIVSQFHYSVLYFVKTFILEIKVIETFQFLNSKRD